MSHECRHSFKIVDLAKTDDLTLQVANLLVDSFDHAWPDLLSAVEEVKQTLPPEFVSRVAVDADGAVIGWIAGSWSYAKVWELHPLVVRSDLRNRV